MYFSEESIAKAFDEALPLLKAHYDEIAHFKDIELDPDLGAYLQIENAGGLRVFTVRTESGELIGYSVFFVRHNLHYRKSLQAIQDVLFVKKNHRGMGGKFIEWCDQQLFAEGVQVVYHHTKVAHNFGPLLERIGYQKVDEIYARRP